MTKIEKTCIVFSGRRGMLGTRKFICDKCGWDSAEVMYRDGLNEPLGANEEEYLAVKCHRCGYSWREETLK
jgi:DNA-directed RNA polymerase subunit M/transcription elongation factor TFIIS